MTAEEEKKDGITKLEMFAKLGGKNIRIVYRAKVRYRSTWVRSERPWRIQWYKYSTHFPPKLINFKTFEGLEKGVMRLIDLSAK